MRALLLAGVVVLGMSGVARAAVTYDVSYGGATFSYRTADFLTTETVVPSSGLASYSAGVTAVSFLPSCPDAGGSDCDEISVSRFVDPFPYVDLLYFSGPAFTSDGVYPNFNIFSGGTLTVSGTPDVAVSEPATLALLALPLGITGLTTIGCRLRPAGSY